MTSTRDCHFGSGSEIVNKELAALEKLGVKPRLRTLMEEIIVNDEGRVVGVKIREGYRFPNKDSGKVKYLAAKRAVVLCYGGFSADAQFRQIYDPKLTNKFDMVLPSLFTATCVRLSLEGATFCALSGLVS